MVNTFCVVSMARVVLCPTKHLVDVVTNKNRHNYSFLKPLCMPITHSVNHYNEKCTDEVEVAVQNPKKPLWFSRSKRNYLKTGRATDDRDTFGTLSADLENVTLHSDSVEVEKGDRFDSFKVVGRRRRQQYYVTLVKQHLEQKNLREAISVLENRMLKEDGAKPEYFIYHLLIAACARVGYSKKAFQLFNQMKKRGLKVRASVYTSLFSACANSPFPNDSLKRMSNLHQLMIEKGVQPNALIYNAMIKAFGRCGDLVTALKLFEEMIAKQFPVKDDTINNLLQACISDRESGFHHALLVWRKLLNMKITPNVHSYNLMLRATRDCNIGDAESAQKMLGTVAEEGKNSTSIPKITPQNSKALKIIDVSTANGNETLSLTNVSNNTQMKNGQLVQKMESISVLQTPRIPDTEAKLYTELSESKLFTQGNPNFLAAQPQLGSVVSLTEIVKPEERLLLLGGYNGVLDHMASMGVTPNIKTFTLLLDCIPATLAAEHELIFAMTKNAIEPDIDFYNMLIRRRNLRADYKDAKEVLNSIHTKKLLPNILTFGVLAIGCESEADAKELMMDMQSVGYRMNSEILGAMLYNACFRVNFSYIRTVMEAIKEEEICPNLKFLEELKKFNTKCVKLLQSKRELPSGESKRTLKENFENFTQYYKKWLKTVQPEIEQHPWRQFHDCNTSTA